MTKNELDRPLPATKPGANGSPVKRRLQQAVIGLLIVAAGFGGAAYFKQTAPRADKRPPVVVAPLVEVTAVAPDRHQVRVTAMGTVVPARALILESRVTGEVIRLHPEFQVGGLLTKDEEALQIDPGDYELALTRAESAVVEANTPYRWRRAVRRSPGGSGPF